MRERAGFSLLELVMVMVVIGAVTALSGPPMVQALRQTKARSAASQFRSAHVLTRATALRYGRLAELHIDATNKRFWVEVDTSQVGGVCDTVGTVVRVGDVNLKMASNRSLLCFDHRGLSTTQGACDPGDATVTFSAWGQVDSVRTSVVGKVLR
jgi:prepilin-type N-terminal cleavage/methylation domain-containing protein